MGQKVSPIGFRLYTRRDWHSSWYTKPRNYAKFLIQDQQIRQFLRKNLNDKSIAKIEIHRFQNRINIIIHTSHPGQIIGKKGSSLEINQKKLSKIYKIDVKISIAGIDKPELNATLAAKSIADQIENHVNYRRAAKKAVQSAMLLGAKGIRVNCSGRLAGAEIARMEWYKKGRVPLQTIRADIDYAEIPAHTDYGCIGIKVWIFKGEDLDTVTVKSLKNKSEKENDIKSKGGDLDDQHSFQSKETLENAEPILNQEVKVSLNEDAFPEDKSKEVFSENFEAKLDTKIEITTSSKKSANSVDNDNKKEEKQSNKKGDLDVSSAS